MPEDTIGKDPATLTIEQIDAELKIHRHTLMGGNVAALGNIHVRISDLERERKRRSPTKSIVAHIKDALTPFYVCVQNYGCINYGVHLFDTEPEAIDWWKRYTELEIPTTEAEAEAIGQNEDYGEVRVYRVTWDPSTNEWLSQDVIWEKARNKRRCQKCGTMMDYCEPKGDEAQFTPFYICPKCQHTEIGEKEEEEEDE